MNTTKTQIIVRVLNSSVCRGFVQLHGRTFPCLLGKTGQTFRKHEGDGKSPKGRWKLVALRYRPDKMIHIRSRLKTNALRHSDGWCDAVSSKDYNRKVKLPFGPSHEELWRKDSAYDLLVFTDHNQRPRVKGAGSAIFFHLIRDGAKYTEGCIALNERDMRLVLAACGRNAYLVI